MFAPTYISAPPGLVGCQSDVSLHCQGETAAILAVNVGRPREHDEATRELLQEAAERIVADKGLEALSVRAVADAARTTTRAVYSSFRSKERVGGRAHPDGFEFLYTEIERLPETTDPTNDLVDMAIRVFRRLALEHPVLYRIAFQRVEHALRAGPDVTAARQRAFAQLQNKIRRLEQDGTFTSRSTTQQ